MSNVAGRKEAALATAFTVQWHSKRGRLFRNHHAAKSPVIIIKRLALRSLSINRTELSRTKLPQGSGLASTE